MLGALTLTAGLWAAPAMAEEKTYTQPTLNPHVKSIIEVDGYQFIDLNSNGTLDPYEDWRLDADTRTADLVGQMTVREKIAQMQHPTYLPRADGKIPSYLNKWCNKEGIGMLLIRELNSVEAAAVSMNTIQEYAEGSRLGVPVLVSMDSVHGLSYVSGATVTGHNLALAATRDEDLVTRLAEIARDEHIAIGVRMTLSPEADIASEPRWGRVMETFGEDPDLVTKMVTAQVVAFQNGRDGLNTGAIVACMKHFPGAGPQMEGKDTSPIISSAETLQIHLKPYYAALEKELLDAINATGFGPQGFGGATTCLGVAIEQKPTHVACLPVAVNISCHVTRRASRPVMPAGGVYWLIRDIATSPGAKVSAIQSSTCRVLFRYPGSTRCRRITPCFISPFSSYTGRPT